MVVVRDNDVLYNKLVLALYGTYQLKFRDGNRLNLQRDNVIIGGIWMECAYTNYHIQNFEQISYMWYYDVEDEWHIRRENNPT